MNDDEGEEFDWKKPIEVSIGEFKKRKIHLTFGITLQAYKKIDEGKTFLQYFHGIIFSNFIKILSKVLSFNTKKNLTKKEKREKVNNRSKHLQPSIIATLKNSFELNDEYLTVENYEHHLKTDPVGKLILETRK